MRFNNILLVQPSRISGLGFFWEPIPLGLEYIAAYIQDHVDKINIVDLTKDPKKTEYYLKILKPDLVGISINFAINHNESLKIAQKAKEYGASVVIGGYHATGLAEEMAADPNIDFIVRGEGEQTILELIQKGSAEEVKGVSYFSNGKIIHNPDRPLIKDLDSIPFPARHRRKYRYSSTFFSRGAFDVIMTSRGCYGKCKFCSEPLMCKGIQRYRKPAEIIKEIQEISKYHNNNKVLKLEIFDPNFGGNPKITEELCDQLIELRSKNKLETEFLVPIRVNTIANNENLMRKMIHAGIDIICFGIETPNDQHLKLMDKKVTRTLQEEAIKKCIALGGKVSGDFAIGFPYQKEEDIWQCINYAKNININYPVFSIVTPHPGTELYKELKTKGLLVKTNWDDYDYFHLVFKHEFLAPQRLRELNITAWIRSYNLLLKNESREARLRGQKESLIPIFNRALSFFRAMANIIKKEDILFLEKYFKEFINPDLKRFTEEEILQNTFELTSFLRMMGKQKIQITVNLFNKPIVSWIIKTTKTSLEYIEAINGSINDASININFEIENMNRDKNDKESNIFVVSGKAIKSVLKCNKGISAKFNLIRLFIAIGSEFIAYKLNLSKSKNIVI
ncbi:MAG: radical SAM protein [Candidatus Saganbacteria bacterium]|nr:radical SAM protein [Candidatus Saganbacteria bacterium]